MLWSFAFGARNTPIARSTRTFRPRQSQPGRQHGAAGTTMSTTRSRNSEISPRDHRVSSGHGGHDHPARREHDPGHDRWSTRPDRLDNRGARLRFGRGIGRAPTGPRTRSRVRCDVLGLHGINSSSEAAPGSAKCSVSSWGVTEIHCVNRGADCVRLGEAFSADSSLLSLGNHRLTAVRASKLRRDPRPI